MNRWFVAETLPRQERVAEQNLQRQGFGTYLPVYRHERRHARKVDLVKRPLFPNYIFVDIDLEAARWRSVNGTVGCKRLISFGDTPQPVPDPVIAALHARTDAEGFIRMADPLDAFEPGTPARITDGPFADMVGLFQCRNDQMRVILLLDMLGRPTRVTVPANAIAAA